MSAEKMSYSAGESDDLGVTSSPLCREPWESIYILRRGILPCCYGNPIAASMKDYAEAWNSAKLRKIRRYLSRGKLSPYCRDNLTCPIVQRFMKDEVEAAQNSFLFMSSSRPLVLRFLNKALLGLPRRIRRLFKRR